MTQDQKRDRPQSCNDSASRREPSPVQFSESTGQFPAFSTVSIFDLNGFYHAVAALATSPAAPQIAVQVDAQAIGGTVFRADEDTTVGQLGRSRIPIARVRRWKACL
jgi:hypothetical protein